jgi:putative ABC transport system substrate-binding protein
MKRREFITLLGGATAAAGWPLGARAQKAALPVVGFLDSRVPDALADRLRGFRQGLKEAGFVEGENVAILYRWAENHPDRLPALAADLVSRQVAAIVVSGGPAVSFAAKAATTKIPIVFGSAQDPVRLGLVASFARPGGNLTGISFLNRDLADKQLELLRELVPGATRIAALVNPADAMVTESTLRQVDLAAQSMGLQVQVARASTSREIDTAFVTFARERADAVFVSGDPFFGSRRQQLSLVAMRHALPAIYSGREYAEAGGLIAYGTDISDTYRQMAVYVGRILKGAKPADLPIMQSTKIELVINAQTARLLGLTVPPTLLATADEVIE